MGKLYKRGRTYYGDYEDQRGRRRRVSLGTQDRAVAKVKLRRLEMGSVDPAAHSTQRLTDAIDHLLDVAMPAEGRAKGTIECYEQKGRHLARVLGHDCELGDITRDDVQRYIGLRLAEDAARGTVHKELVTLRRVLTEAQGRGLYAGDPRSLVPPFAVDYQPKTRWLPPDELEQLITAIRQPRRRLWAMVAAFSGARDSEIEGLDWATVHLDKGLIRILTTKTSGQPFWRDVPILDQLKPWLQRFEGAGPVVEPWGNVRRDLHAACARIGIEPCSPNDLRRTFASYMLQAGVPVIVVSRMMGHKSTRMVELVYGQLGLNSFEGAGARCAAYVTESLSNLGKPGDLGTEPEKKKPAQTAPESDLSGFKRVPGDRVELPTRGFSVPVLTVVSGGKNKGKRHSG